MGDYKDIDKKPIYVIGHKNPDTDSIAAAIAYAELKSKISDEKYIAARCGNVSSETQYVLDRFNFKAPKFIGDVRTQVRDMEIRRIPGVNGEMSLKEAWKIMKDNNVVTLCITEGKKLRGLITTGDIMESYMGSLDTNALALSRTSYKNILETLDGEPARTLSIHLHRRGERGALLRQPHGCGQERSPQQRQNRRRHRPSGDAQPSGGQLGPQTQSVGTVCQR